MLPLVPKPPASPIHGLEQLADFLEQQEKLAMEHVGQLVVQQEHIMCLGKQYDECMG